MGSAIKLRDDFDGGMLRGLEKRSRDGAQSRRLTALAEIFDGRRRSDASRVAGVGPQIIRDWVLRFNAKGMTVAISPHCYYPTDHGWRFGGSLEKLMHAIGMFDRKGPLTTEGFEGSGADFMPEYKEYIEDGKTIIASPQKGLRARSSFLAPT